MLNSLLPHAHELPFLELLEKTQLLDVVIRVALDEPLAQRDELNRHIILVKGETLARQRVVSTVVFVRIAYNHEVIGVAIVLSIQVHKDGLLFAFGV